MGHVLRVSCTRRFLTRCRAGMTFKDSPQAYAFLISGRGEGEGSKQRAAEGDSRVTGLEGGFEGCGRGLHKKSSPHSLPVHPAPSKPSSPTLSPLSLDPPPPQPFSGLLLAMTTVRSLCVHKRTPGAVLSPTSILARRGIKPRFKVMKFDPDWTLCSSTTTISFVTLSHLRPVSIVDRAALRM
jgi:hypothetical protein